MTLQEVKGGGEPSTLTARHAGESAGKQQDENSGGDPRIPQTTDVESVSGKPLRGGEGGGGGRGAKHGDSERKLATPLRKKEDNAMLRVRQDIRQPVTSLWQTAAERAKTAPTRLVSRGGGGMEDCTSTTARRDLSRRQRHSQNSPPRAKKGGIGLSNATVAPGGDNLKGDVGKGSKGRGRAPREDGPENSTGLTAPVCGPGGGAVDGDQRGRTKTPIPLRSSHRVGPVGSLGERRAHAYESEYEAHWR